MADHLTAELVFAEPNWSLEQAAVAMVRGGFRHLVVVDEGEIAGILSVRDVVRCWTTTARAPTPPAAPVKRPQAETAAATAARARRQWMLGRELVDLARRRADPQHGRDEEEDEPDDDADDEGDRDGDDRDRQARPR